MNTTNRLLLMGLFTGIVSFAAVSCERSRVSAANENDSLNSQKILSMDDQAFLVGAEKSMVRQKTLAQKVLPRSDNAAVVEFARAVVDDNDKSAAELQALMKQKHIQEPAPFVEDLQIDANNRLDNLSGMDLNDQFISLIAAEQQQELRSFNSAAETSGDPDVRAYAQKLLPSLQQERDRSVQIQRKLHETSSAK
jgi:putative membrane protein